jgi:hypothetical protein
LPLRFEFLSRSPDNGFILSGLVSYGSSSDIIIIKVDSLGNLQWSKRLIPSIQSTSYFNHVLFTSDGNYVLSGYRNLHSYLLKIDPLGNILWMKKYDAGILGNATWVEETFDHGLIVAGSFQINTAGQTSILMKTDSAGNLEWARALGGYSDIWTGCVKQTEDRGFIIGARVIGPGGGERFFLIKTDSLGHTAGCLEDTVSVIITNLNDSAINFPVTETLANISTVADTLILIDTGAVITLCAPLDVMEADKEIEQIKIYPNPFTDVLSITVNEKDPSEIILYDITSRKLLHQTFTNSITLNTARLAKGIYLYEVRNKNGVVKKGKVVKE